MELAFTQNPLGLGLICNKVETQCMVLSAWLCVWQWPTPLLPLPPGLPKGLHLTPTLPLPSERALSLGWEP